MFHGVGGKQSILLLNQNHMIKIINKRERERKKEWLYSRITGTNNLSNMKIHYH